MKKLLSIAAAAAAIFTAAPASAVVVAGIDFGATGANAHLETATLAESFVGAVGDKLSGYGLITTVNGSSNYCAVGTCSLYYHFHDYTVTQFSPLAVRFSGGIVDLYVKSGSPVNLLNANSPTNITTITTTMTPWARLTGHMFDDLIVNALLGPGAQTLNGFGSLTGPNLTQTGSGMLDADLSGTFGSAAAAAYLDGNDRPDGFGGNADVIFTSSTSNAVLNAQDVSSGLTAGCQTGTAAAGAWCFQGTSNIRGTAKPVPEPAGIALVGLGLFAAGVARRYGRKA